MKEGHNLKAFDDGWVGLAEIQTGDSCIMMTGENAKYMPQ
jgi:hypothetical protein